jgi:hypothetical protein
MCSSHWRWSCSFFPPNGRGRDDKSEQRTRIRAVTWSMVTTIPCSLYCAVYCATCFSLTYKPLSGTKNIIVERALICNTINFKRLRSQRFTCVYHIYIWFCLDYIGLRRKEMCNLRIGIKYLHNMCHNKNVKFRNYEGILTAWLSGN